MSDRDSDAPRSDSVEGLQKVERKRKKSSPTEQLVDTDEESDDAPIRRSLKKKSSKRVPASRRVRNAPSSRAESFPIPGSMQEFTEPDRVMWDMRKAGKPWAEIRGEWERLTGQKTGSTTLPNRFVRIRDKILDFDKGDDKLLLSCKHELEKTFSSVLWQMIAETMVNKGGTKFSAAAIEKRHEQLSQTLKEEEMTDAAESADDDV